VPFRANIAGESFDPFKDNYISPGFMTLPAPYTFGTAAFNYNLRGFASYNEDLMLAKIFRVGERVRFELRGETFNAFNRVVWRAPGTNVSASDFGKISGQENAPRTIQLGLKINY
jgi:hypothetical protein